MNFSFAYHFQFRFTDGTDRLLIFLGVIFAIIGGATFPIMIDVFSDMVDTVIYNSGTEKYLDDNWNSTEMDRIGLTKDDILDDPDKLR